MPSKQQLSQPKAGFTIIEVVLVLAIAGLIFLMVFVALPALQRSQRDTQRRNDMSRVDTSLVQYQTNNMSAGSNLTALPEGDSYWAACADGTFTDSCAANANAGASANPSVAENFIQRYMNSGTDATTNTFQDPDGVYYSMFISKNMVDGQAPTTGNYGAANIKKDGTNNRYTIGTDYNAHIVYVFPGAKCDGEFIESDTSRHFAVMYRLEGAGVYCIDDQ